MKKLLLASPIIEESKKHLIKKIKLLKNKGICPKMKVVLVGNSTASEIYVNNKKLLCENIGADCEIIRRDSKISKMEFIKLIQDISNDDLVHGIIVQLPLPKQLSNINFFELIPPHKDIDGFNPINLGKLVRNSQGEDYLAPCTPTGVMKIFSHNKISLKGKRVLVVGRSLIVGKPLSIMLTNNDATVTLAHSKSKNLKQLCFNSEIIISCVGKLNFIKANYLNSNIKPIIIDVGINRLKNKQKCSIRNKSYSIQGDLRLDKVYDQVKFITPVPGGVGPLTVLCLIENLIKSTEYIYKKNKKRTT